MFVVRSYTKKEFDVTCQIIYAPNMCILRYVHTVSVVSKAKRFSEINELRGFESSGTKVFSTCIKSTLFEVDRRGVTRVVIRNSRTNNKRCVNTFVYEELLIIDNFSEIYFLKTKKGKVKKGKILSKHV